MKAWWRPSRSRSVVKLIAFLAVGVFVTFVMFDGAGDMFSRAAQHAGDRAGCFSLASAIGGFGGWVTLTLAVDGGDPVPAAAVPGDRGREHGRAAPGKAAWLFPLYLLTINLFVLPHRGRRAADLPRRPAIDGDTFVLALPIVERQPLIALVRLHRRPVGGDRHGDRRDHRALDHGVQRSGHADPAAAALAAADRARRSHAAADRDPARQYRR